MGSSGRGRDRVRDSGRQRVKYWRNRVNRRKTEEETTKQIGDTGIKV